MRNNELEMEEISGGNAELAAALQRNGLPTDDLEESGRRFFGFRDAEGRRVGFIGVEWAGGDALLRSLVVEEDRRGQGFGQGIARWALDWLQRQGVREVYLLTTTAATLAARMGFQPVNRDEVPATIRTTRQFAALCPASAVVMRLEQSGPGRHVR